MSITSAECISKDHDAPEVYFDFPSAAVSGLDSYRKGAELTPIEKIALTECLRETKQRDGWIRACNDDNTVTVFCIRVRDGYVSPVNFSKCAMRLSAWELLPLPSCERPLDLVLCDLGIGGNGPGRPNGGREERRRLLGGLLRVIMEAAGFCTVVGRPTANAFDRLLDCLRPYQVAEGVGALECSSAAQGRCAWNELSASLARQRWPRHVRPYGLVFAVVSAHEGHTVTVAAGRHTETWKVKNLRVPGWQNTPGPFLGVFVMVNGVGGPCLLDGFLQPIFSRFCWMPIDSNLEREALGVCLAVAASAAQEYDTQLRIQRPIRAEYVANVMFDFHVGLFGGEHVLAIEVLGSDNQTYLTRKRDNEREYNRLGLVEPFLFDAFLARRKGRSNVYGQLAAKLTAWVTTKARQQGRQAVATNV